MTISKAFLWPAKAALIFLSLMVASMAGGMIFYAGYQSPEGVREFDEAAMMRAGLIVQAANAILLAVLASWSRLSRLGTAALLFVIFFFAQTFLSVMEQVYLNEFFNLPTTNTLRNAGMGALTALVGALVAALLFAGRGARDAGSEARSRGALLGRFALATALYPVAYWTAGLIFVVPSETVHAFYGDDFTDLVAPGPLLAFQILRGAIWAGLALAAVHGLRGPVLARAILVGAAFSVFMAVVLFYPTPIMPEAVRMVHLVEIGTSNFIYGIIAALLLAPSRNREAAAIAA